jgi:hypothetical protein
VFHSAPYATSRALQLYMQSMQNAVNLRLLGVLCFRSSTNSVLMSNQHISGLTATIGASLQVAVACQATRRRMISEPCPRALAK